MIKSLRANWQSLFFLFLLVWMLVAAAYHGALNPDSGLTGIDFAIYRRAAGWLNAGEPLYYSAEQRSPYMYAPLVAWALRPLAAMPMEQALKIWFFVNACALLLAAALYAIAARLRLRHAAALGILLIVAFRFWPTTCNLGMGQVNPLLLTLVAGMLLADSRGRMGTVAVLIAMAALVKLWMLAAGIHLLVRRKWGAAIGCGVAFVALLAGNFAIIGWHEWPGFIATVTSEHASVQPGLVSQSILGFARLRFSDSGLVVPFADNPLLQHGFVAIGFLAVGAALAWLMWSAPARTTYESHLRFGFAILSMLLLLPICHMEYYILAIPLFWALFAPGAVARVHPLTVLFAIGAYVAFTRPVPVSGPGLATARESGRALMVSLPFFTAIILWLTTLCELRRLRTLAPQPAPQLTPTPDPIAA